MAHVHIYFIYTCTTIYKLYTSGCKYDIVHVYVTHNSITVHVALHSVFSVGKLRCQVSPGASKRHGPHSRDHTCGTVLDWQRCGETKVCEVASASLVKQDVVAVRYTEQIGLNYVYHSL